MFKPFNKVVFRFPTYPVKVLRQALEDEKYFVEIISSKTFQEAIFFASPVLHEELLKYLDNKQKEKDRVRTRNSLIRYLARMSTRCTPFGMFATCSTAYTDETTDLVLADGMKVHFRFDMLYLCNLAQMLEKMPEMKKVMKYYVNTTIYQRGNKIRYIEYFFDTQQRNYQLVEIAAAPSLDIIMEAAKDGVTSDELVKLFVEDYEIPEDSAASYIDSIINNQILVSEIDPIVTGDDFFEHIVEVMSRIDQNLEVYAQVMQMRELLGQLNSDLDNDKIAIGNQLEEVVKELKVPYQKKYLLQVDSIRQMDKNKLGQEVLDTMSECMTFLNKFAVRMDSQVLNDFKATFNRKYEGQEIPLLEALDPEIGIGFPANQVKDLSPLLAGLALPNRPNGNVIQAQLMPMQTLLQRKLFSYNPQTDECITLKDEDVKVDFIAWNDMPATIYTNMQIIDKKIGGKDYALAVHYFGGNSGANMLGRFAYCEEEIHKLVEEIVEKDRVQYKDVIVAEISHVPDSRIGNILARPKLREFEIIYLANSTRSRDEVIYPADIMVSVQNNQIMLRSKKHNKYIFPRLTTAHNFNNNPTPMYRFLCELQSQNLRSAIFFNWGALEQQLDFLPRVCYKNVILSFAKWKVNVADIQHLVKEKDEAKLMEGVKQWRDKIRLPRFITLSDSDNTLFVDLENLKSVYSFLSVLTNRQSIVLEEFLEENPTSITDKNGNGYANECVVAFYNEIQQK